MFNGFTYTVNQVSGYDGDGVKVKEVDTRSNAPGFVNTTYYLRSSVLRGAIVEELSQAGQKTIGYVCLPGGQLLATQSGDNPNQVVTWKHDTAAGTGEYTTNTNNGLAGRVEFDPLGADISLTEPPQPPPFGDEGDIGAQHFGGIMDQRCVDFFNLDSGFTENGFPISSSEAMFYLNFGTGNRGDSVVSPEAVANALGVAFAGPGASMVRFGSPGVEGTPGHQTAEWGWQDLGNGQSIWTLVSTSYSGIAAIPGSMVSLASSGQARQPSRAQQVMIPLKDVNDLKIQMQNRLDYGDCAEAVKKLIAQLGKNALDSKNPDNQPVFDGVISMFEKVANQGGITVNVWPTKYPPGGQNPPGGSGYSWRINTWVGGNYQPEYKVWVYVKGGFTDSRAYAFDRLPYEYGITEIHEMLHQIGRFMYSEDELNKAGTDLGGQGVDDYLRNHCNPAGFRNK